MAILDETFMQGFIDVCAEGYRKGWHERNGGNLSYRMSEADVEAAKPSFATSNNPIPSIGELVLVK